MNVETKRETNEKPRHSRRSSRPQKYLENGPARGEAPFDSSVQPWQSPDGNESVHLTHEPHQTHNNSGRSPGLAASCHPSPLFSGLGLMSTTPLRNERGSPAPGATRKGVSTACGASVIAQLQARRRIQFVGSERLPFSNVP